MSTSNPDTTVVLISGANTGIGLAVASRLAREYQNYTIIIGSRSAQAGEQAAATLSSQGLSVSSVQLDLSSDSSIAAAVHTITTTHGHLDILINNAAILLDLASPLLPTRDLFTQTFSTNVIGTACLTEACMPLLRKSSLPRIIFVSSRMGSLAEATNKSMPFFDWDIKAYDSSKAAVNMLALNYARLLADQGGLVNVVCPGLVNTKLSGNPPAGAAPEVGAQRIIEIATLKGGEVTATFSDRDGVIPW